MTPPRLLTALFLLFLSLYIHFDPFQHSAISQHPNFHAFPIHLSPRSELPTEKDHLNLLQKSEIRFLNQVQGPESIAFDPLGRGPYTGLADGRVVFWNGASWSDFAYTSPNRSDEFCNWKPSPLSYLKNEHICGRPLGLRFDKKNGDLYIADAYFGLLKVGPEGGFATPIVTEAEGVPLGFTNDLDLDEDGNVYFTDSSTIYQRRNFLQLVFSGENSGRVLKYDPLTKQTTVLVRNIQFPNGITMSKDGSFFIFCEGSRGRLIKYWLKGEKAGVSEVLAVLPGFPDNVRTNKDGEFWVAIHCRHNFYYYLFAHYPNIRKFLLKLPISAKIHYIIQVGGRPHAMAIKYCPEGKILQVLEDTKGKVVKAISEVEEKDGKLWMGSVMMPFIAVYDL